MTAAAEVHVVDHPLVQHKLTQMRRKETSSADFRLLLEEISYLLGYELTRDLPTREIDIETPVTATRAPVMAGKNPALVSILRAGNGLVEGLLRLMPTSRVGHVGLYRDHDTLQPVEYYFKMPDRLPERHTIVVDPMLATGNSAAAAVARVKELNPLSLRFLCLLAAPEGIESFQRQHPDVPIYTAAIDSHLNEKGYIVPGLGDAGDRIYGTV
ncbi:MAG: uracil phosphoribosyltransferase [Acidobacteriota bacterium]